MDISYPIVFIKTLYYHSAFASSLPNCYSPLEHDLSRFHPTRCFSHHQLSLSANLSILPAPSQALTLSLSLLSNLSRRVWQPIDSSLRRLVTHRFAEADVRLSRDLSLYLHSIVQQSCHDEQAGIANRGLYGQCCGQSEGMRRWRIPEIRVGAPAREVLAIARYLGKYMDRKGVQLPLSLCHLRNARPGWHWRSLSFQAPRPYPANP